MLDFSKSAFHFPTVYGMRSLVKANAHILCICSLLKHHMVRKQLFIMPVHHMNTRYREF